jgi:hypothetical protein
MPTDPKPNPATPTDRSVRCGAVVSSKFSTIVALAASFVPESKRLDTNRAKLGDDRSRLEGRGPGNLPFQITMHTDLRAKPNNLTDRSAYG